MQFTVINMGTERDPSYDGLDEYFDSYYLTTDKFFKKSARTFIRARDGPL